MGQLAGDLDLYYEDVYGLPAAQRIEYARRAEAAALSADPRISRRATAAASMRRPGTR